MRIQPIAEYAVVVEMLMHPKRGGRIPLQLDPELDVRQPCERSIQGLIFQYSTARHEPVTLRRSIVPQPEQNLAVPILDHQIDRHQRGRCDNRAEDLPMKLHCAP